MKYNCPVCGTEMLEALGNTMHKDDAAYGLTLMCPAPHPSVCMAQEVMGHGGNVKEAWKAVQDKFVLRENRD
jgi:hypothetical protein